MTLLRNLPVTPLSPFFVFEQFADRLPLIVVAASLAMGGVATDRVEQRFPFPAVPYFTKYCLRSDGKCRSEAMEAIGEPIVKRHPESTPGRHEELTPLVFADLKQAARERALHSVVASELAMLWAELTLFSPILPLLQRVFAEARCGVFPSNGSCRRGS
jgi:hypothetical protein